MRDSVYEYREFCHVYRCRLTDMPPRDTEQMHSGAGTSVLKDYVLFGLTREPISIQEVTTLAEVGDLYLMIYPKTFLLGYVAEDASAGRKCWLGIVLLQSNAVA